MEEIYVKLYAVIATVLFIGIGIGYFLSWKKLRSKTRECEWYKTHYYIQKVQTEEPPVVKERKKIDISHLGKELRLIQNS